jgi:hypothetical protein
MPFKPEKAAPQFADLKGMLAQSKITDNALHQTLQILIDRLDQLEVQKADVVSNINNSVNTIHSLVNYYVNNANNNTGSYLTVSPEEAIFPLSRQLLPGVNVTFDDSVPNRRTVNASGGAVPNPHAPTHHYNGSDIVDVKALGGYPGGTTAFLRADRTFAVPPGGGAGGGMNLDYLGNYVSGPAYNDGDIVIASDGIAYMCVVDATFTPPEPWPGIGVAANIAIDGSYWIAKAHSSLFNARVMDGRGTGYVRSAAGEPSVVATIPLTDTTGILPDNRLTSNVALKNIDNNFVAQTLGSYSRINGGNSALYFNDTTAPINNRLWRFLDYSNGAFYLEALTDDQTAVQVQYSFDRVGNFSAPVHHGNGVGLHSLNASNLATGLANPARLGSGTANSSTFLRGDSTWASVTGIPSGLIVLSDAPCPAGWTRITAWDGRYLMAGVPNIGGSASHTHDAGSLGVPGHGHGAGVSTLSGDHTHPFSVWIAGRTADSQGGSSGADAGGSFTAPYYAHSHDFGAGMDGNTGGGGNHSHETTVPDAGGMAVTGGTGYANNDPLFVSLYFCRKD